MLLPVAALLALQTAPALPSDSEADARCIVVLGFIGSRGSAEDKDKSRGGILYFTGKLLGRDAGTDVALTVTRAADNAKVSGISSQAEGTRCAAEITAAGTALGRMRDVSPRPAPSPGPSATPRGR